MDVVDCTGGWYVQTLPPVQLVNCAVDLKSYYLRLSPSDDFLKVVFPQMVKLKLDPREHALFGIRLCEQNHYGIKWSVQVPVPHLEMDPSLLNPKDRDAEKATYEWMKATLDVKKLIWPYPDEQLQWLLDTLDGLGGTALESVKRTDEQWHKTRYSNCFTVFSLAVFHMRIFSILAGATTGASFLTATKPWI